GLATARTGGSRLPLHRSVLGAALAALALASCAEDPLGRDVVAAARSGGQVAFDVVKIDDAVVTTLSAQPRAEFHQRLKEYLPPPELKIAPGDTLSVVIW